MEIKIEAGEGYRLLGEHECVRQGDEFLFAISNQWKPSSKVGLRAKPSGKYILAYRRRVCAPEQVKSSKFERKTALEVAELGTDTHRKIEANAKMMAAMMDIALTNSLLCPMPPVILSPLAGVSDADLQAELDRRQYRMLTKGEVILRTDEYRDTWKGWSPVTVAAGMAMMKVDEGNFRRKK